MTDEHDPAFRLVAQAILWEFANACADDPDLGEDYLSARDRWHAATTDEEREVADDAYVDVIERFSDARGLDLTADEVRAMRALRNR